MYDMKYFREHAVKLTPRCIGLYASYELDGHIIDMWFACSPYISIRIDNKPVVTRALRRNGVKLALKYLNNNES